MYLYVHNTAFSDPLKTSVDHDNTTKTKAKYDTPGITVASSSAPHVTDVKREV